MHIYKHIYVYAEANAKLPQGQQLAVRSVLD